jgi:hypothetical protein
MAEAAKEAKEGKGVKETEQVAEAVEEPVEEIAELQTVEGAPEAMPEVVPEVVPECMYCPVLEVMQAKKILHRIMTQVHTSDGLRKAIEQGKAMGGGQAAVLKFVNPAMVLIQSDVISEFGFQTGREGAAQLGLSLNRCLEKYQDRELMDMMSALQQQAQAAVAACCGK